MQKFLKLIKSKSGSFASTCMVFPLWIFLIILMGVEVSNHQRLEELVETNQIVSRLIVSSETFDEVNESISTYIESLKTAENYKKISSDDESSYIDIISVSEKVSDGYITTTPELTDIKNSPDKYWKEMNTITYRITIYTNAHNSKAYQVTFSGYTITLTDDSYSITTTVLLCR